jgi:hypothetical protein
MTSLTDSSAHRVVVPFQPVLGRSAMDLLRAAADGIEEAAEISVPAERYACAHLAALRTAAAVLAARARPSTASERAEAGGIRRPSGRGRRLRSAWELLVEVAPEMGEWADFFAAGARKRAAAEAGVWGAVTAREADDLVRAVENFFELVCRMLRGTAGGVPRAQPELPIKAG